jgi:hypothetical protein
MNAPQTIRVGILSALCLGLVSQAAGKTSDPETLTVADNPGGGQYV